MQGEPELVVYTTPDVEQLEVSIIQVEVARQLLSRRRSDMPAVGLLLVGREEFDWHRRRTLCHLRHRFIRPLPNLPVSPSIQPELAQNPLRTILRHRSAEDTYIS